jgi:hypothetical protein
VSATKRLERQRRLGLGSEAHESCERKYRFPTERRAKIAASNIRAKSGDRMRVYACTYCPGFHLTTERT